jgi:SAM-dependent methyltransferase
VHRAHDDHRTEHRRRVNGRRFDTLVAEAAARPVDGWDFSWLGDRMQILPLPWDFDAIVRRRAQASSDLLDLGTGGGEWLAQLPDRPARAVATESWPANVAIATARLTPLGIEVVQTEPAPDNVDQGPDDPRGALPFPGDSFSLVTSRHTAYVPRELARVLRPGGSFVTEQVGGDYGDFYEALGLERPAARRLDLAFAASQLRAAGLEVVASADGVETTAFSDVGAFAWYLKAVPWTVAGFAIETHRDALEHVHARIERDGALTTQLPAFWLEARRRSETV